MISKQAQYRLVSALCRKTGTNDAATIQQVLNGLRKQAKGGKGGNKQGGGIRSFLRGLRRPRTGGQQQQQSTQPRSGQFKQFLQGLQQSTQSRFGQVKQFLRDLKQQAQPKVGQVKQFLRDLKQQAQPKVGQVKQFLRGLKQQAQPKVGQVKQFLRGLRRPKADGQQQQTPPPTQPGGTAPKSRIGELRRFIQKHPGASVATTAGAASGATSLFDFIMYKAMSDDADRDE